RLAGRVADGIVRPRGELVLAAVERPRVARARLGHLKAEARVRHDVDPGRRRAPALLENRDVLAPMVAEAAEAVEELELGPRAGGGGAALAAGSARCARASCSASVPSRLDSTTRAAASSTSRSGAVTRSTRT